METQARFGILLGVLGVALALFGAFAPFEWHEMPGWLTNCALGAAAVLIAWCLFETASLIKSKLPNWPALVSFVKRHHTNVRAAFTREWVSAIYAEHRFGRQSLRDDENKKLREHSELIETLNAVKAQIADLQTKIRNDESADIGALIPLEQEQKRVERSIAATNYMIELFGRWRTEEIHEKLRSGELIAKGFLNPHAHGRSAVVIPKEEWHVLEPVFNDDPPKARGGGIEYIGIRVGKGRTPKKEEEPPF
jgi:hypothetical protein